MSLRIDICEAQVAAGTYEISPSEKRLDCLPGTARLWVDDRGTDCRQSRSWFSRSGSVTVESIDEDEVHVRFDVFMDVREIKPQTATGTFRIRGEIWTDEIQTGE